MKIVKQATTLIFLYFKHYLDHWKYLIILGVLTTKFIYLYVIMVRAGLHPYV